MELRNLTPESFATVESLRQLYETGLEDILRAGQADGSFVLADTKLTPLALIAMLTGVKTWYRDGGRLDRDAVVEIYWNFVRGTVGDHRAGAGASLATNPPPPERALLR